MSLGIPSRAVIVSLRINHSATCNITLMRQILCWKSTVWIWLSWRELSKQGTKPPPGPISLMSSTTGLHVVISKGMNLSSSCPNLSGACPNFLFNLPSLMIGKPKSRFNPYAISGIPKTLHILRDNPALKGWSFGIFNMSVAKVYSTSRKACCTNQSRDPRKMRNVERCFTTIYDWRITRNLRFCRSLRVHSVVAE